MTDPVHPLCQACPALCCRLPTLLLAGDQVPEQHVEQDARGLRWLRIEVDGYCAAYDRQANRCSIYELRPLACRRFEVDGPACRSLHEATS